MVHYPTIIERKTILKPPARSTMYTSSRAVLRRTFPNLFLCKSRVYIYTWYEGTIAKWQRHSIGNCKGEWRDGRTDARPGGQANKGRNERTNKWMSEWLHERMNERMNEWMNKCLSWFELNWNWIELILNWTNEWRVEGALERLSC